MCIVWYRWVTFCSRQRRSMCWRGWTLIRTTGKVIDCSHIDAFIHTVMSRILLVAKHLHIHSNAWCDNNGIASLSCCYLAGWSRKARRLCGRVSAGHRRKGFQGRPAGRLPRPSILRCWVLSHHTSILSAWRMCIGIDMTCCVAVLWIVLGVWLSRSRLILIDCCDVYIGRMCSRWSAIPPTRKWSTSFESLRSGAKKTTWRSPEKNTMDDTIWDAQLISHEKLLLLVYRIWSEKTHLAFDSRDGWPHY